MKKTRAFLRSMLCAGGVLVISTLSAHATAGAVETAVESAIGDAKTAGESALAIAATVIGAFLLFKLVKKAANKA